MKTDYLFLDVEKEVERITGNIARILNSKFKKDGVVIGLSGGIDSSVTTALLVKALGSDKVLGVALPEKESSKDSIILAEKLANQLKIDLIKEDITERISSFGVYSKILSILKSYYPDFSHDLHSYKIVLPQQLLKGQLNLYSLVIEDKNGSQIFKERLSINDYRDFRAALSIKLRVRMISLYYHAERMNRIVAGTTNRSEYELGNFCKYGDGGIDFEVISHLYKTQVYKIAGALDIPQTIIDRAPSPDIFSAFVSDSEFFFSLPFEILDVLLYAHRNGVSVKEIVENIPVNEEQVKRVFTDFERKKQFSETLRELPPVCETILKGG